VVESTAGQTASLSEQHIEYCIGETQWYLLVFLSLWLRIDFYIDRIAPLWQNVSLVNYTTSLQQNERRSFCRGHRHCSEMYAPKWLDLRRRTTVGVNAEVKKSVDWVSLYMVVILIGDAVRV
jgi:hypothetical protein